RRAPPRRGGALARAAGRPPAPGPDPPATAPRAPDGARSEHRPAGEPAADARPADPGHDAPLIELHLPPAGRRRGARTPHRVSHIPRGRLDELPAIPHVRETRAAPATPASARLKGAL